MTTEDKAFVLVEDLINDALDRRKGNNGEFSGGYASLIEDDCLIYEIEVQGNKFDIFAHGYDEMRALMDELESRKLYSAIELDDLTSDTYMDYLYDCAADQEQINHLIRDGI